MNLIVELRERILPWIRKSEVPPPYVDKDINRLHKFINEKCGVKSAEDFPAIREALLLLKKLQDWRPYWSLNFSNRPGDVKIINGIPFLHFYTSDDKEYAHSRPMLISGGAFEMNRRKH